MGIAQKYLLVIYGTIFFLFCHMHLFTSKTAILSRGAHSASLAPLYTTCNALVMVTVDEWPLPGYLVMPLHTCILLQTKQYYITACMQAFFSQGEGSLCYCRPGSKSLGVLTKRKVASISFTVTQK